MIRALSWRLDAGRATVAASVLGAGAFVMWASRTAAAKGIHGVVEIGAATVAPVALWLAWARPILFPYGLYAIVAPLEILTQMRNGEGTIARLIGFASAAALLVYAVRMRSVKTPPRAIIWLALLVGWMALSTLWSMNQQHAGREAMTMVQIAGLYLAVACYPMQRKDMLPLLAAILVGGLLAAAVGIYEFHTDGIAQAQFLQNYDRLDVTLGRLSVDPNLYGDALLLPFAIALAWFARSRKLLGGVTALAAMGILVIALALAASREAMIALVFETIVLVTLLRAWKRVFVPLAVLIGGALAMFPNVVLRAVADTGGGYGRTSIWHVGMAAFLQHPLFGSGSGSFGYVYDTWYLRVFETYDVGWNMASHDLIVHYGVELGLVGLVLLFGWCISQWLLARALPRIGMLGDVRAICIASLVALGLVALLVDLFDSKFLWLAFGLIAQARSLAGSGETA